ncbi:MAG: HEAT repeat domain-containing protein [Nitrospiraceae bacterium]|nr:MAG: HEAT repeat domain-containing protein [Nitrospiraceae bacterium]
MSYTKDNMDMYRKLLGNAIKELNISRHNVSIYPKDHPIVKKSMDLAYENLRRLFEMRTEVAVAVVGDSIMVDEEPLDKQNRVYSEFSSALKRKSISLITFYSKLSKDDLYSFHSFLLSEDGNVSPEEVRSLYKTFRVPNIDIEFIDYSVFGLSDEKKETNDKTVSILEEYITALMNGTLMKEDALKVIQEIPPQAMADMINDVSSDHHDPNSFEKVVSSYIMVPELEKFSKRDLNKIIDVVNHLDPDIKDKFLSLAMNVIAKDVLPVQDALSTMSTQEIILFLSFINEQRVAIPDALKIILRKFSMINHEHILQDQSDGKLIEDDFFLSEKMTSLLSESNFNSFVSEEYQKELGRLIDADIEGQRDVLNDTHDKEWDEEYIETVFHQSILEILSSVESDTLAQQESDFYTNMMKEHLINFLDTGQYMQVLKSITVYKSNDQNNRLKSMSSNMVLLFYSSEFLTHVVDSIRMVGREKKEEVFLLCDYYQGNIIPYLIDTLINEDSPTIRRFLISLITHFGDTASDYILKRLDDSRWFVKRNMLFMLLECGSIESLRRVRHLCNDGHPRVSLEAIKCLLKAGDKHAIEPLRNLLNAKTAESVSRAVSLSGAMQVTDVVPDLLKLLKKKNVTGSDIEDKIPVVRALGQIKDFGSVDILKAILSSKSFIFNSSLKRLKDEAQNALNKIINNQETEKAHI